MAHRAARRGAGLAEVLRAWPGLVLLLAAVLAAPALAWPAARAWALAFLAALALCLGLLTLPALWPGPRWLGEQWNWSGALLALAGALWVAGTLVRRGGLAWRDMGFTWAQRPGALWPALAVAALALVLQWSLVLAGSHAPLTVPAETWLYQATLPGLVEEALFRGLLLALLDRAYPARTPFFGASVGWSGVVVTLLFVLLHGPTPGALTSVLPAGLLYLWLRIFTGSLLLPVLVHNGWNLLAFVAVSAD